MSRTEDERVHVIRRVIDGLLTVREAAELLEMIRHTYRLKANYLLKKEEARKKVVELY